MHPGCSLPVATRLLPNPPPLGTILWLTLEAGTRSPSFDVRGDSISFVGLCQNTSTLSSALIIKRADLFVVSADLLGGYFCVHRLSWARTNATRPAAHDDIQCLLRWILARRRRHRVTKPPLPLLCGIRKLSKARFSFCHASMTTDNRCPRRRRRGSRFS
jgi:hypothetical protein